MYFFRQNVNEISASRSLLDSIIPIMGFMMFTIMPNNIDLWSSTAKNESI